MTKELNTWTFKVVSKNKDALIKYFNAWSDEMDALYLPEGIDRHDAISWIENPADWMKPYDEDIFQLWCSCDSGDPEFHNKIDTYLEKLGR